MSIRTAVIPVAGLGTRLLPATKAIPKELIPIVDTPAVQLILEEACSAGIERAFFITARDKTAIANHFDSHAKLEHLLESQGRQEEMQKVHHATELMKIAFIRQSRMLGIGHAILQARPFVGEEPFAVFFTDDLVQSSLPCIEQLMDVHNEYGGSVVALEPVPLEEVDKYGIISGTRVDDHLYEIEEMVEKPHVDDAPSNLAIIGRYILSPDIFDALERIAPGKEGSLELTDAICSLIKRDDHPVHGLVFQGKRFDVGERLGFLKATVEFALNRPDIGHHFRAWLKKLL